MLPVCELPSSNPLSGLALVVVMGGGVRVVMVAGRLWWWWWWWCGDGVTNS